MGGWGSGGGRDATKTSDLRKIDLADLKRLNFLRTMGRQTLHWTQNGERISSIQIEFCQDCLILSYKFRSNIGSWKFVHEQVPFTRTSQKLGGERIWFRCLSCNRRCRAIFGGEYFRCRNCYHATYPSQYEDKLERLLTRAQSVRMKLGGSGSLDEWFPKKPKWMRWKTYRRLEVEDEQALAVFQAKILFWDLALRERTD